MFTFNHFTDISIRNMLCLQDLSEHLDTTGRFDLIYIVNREGGREGGREVWPKSTPLDGGGVGGQTN